MFESKPIRPWKPATKVRSRVTKPMVKSCTLVIGAPVVSTSLTTGVPFVNQDGRTGLVVPPGDADSLAAALTRLVEDEGLRARLGVQARERALREFTTERMVDDTLAVYRELVEEDV